MATISKIYPNLYKDSVELMQCSAKLKQISGLSQAFVAMATPNNLEQINTAGISFATATNPTDLIVVIEGEEAACQQALEAAHQILTTATTATSSGIQELPPSSLEMLQETASMSNFALISVPGDYAAAEAMKALNLGMNVMLFSDNVPLEQEIQLKKYAYANELMVMGPDCGTAIVDGIPLGFANVVRKGTVGIVSASGTGAQEVSCRIHNLGGGVSHVLGTGGRDLKEKVGGLSMLTGIKILQDDAATQVIVLVSKPPSAVVAATILQEAQKSHKPVVIHFLGKSFPNKDNLFCADSLVAAGDLAFKLAYPQQQLPVMSAMPQLPKVINSTSGYIRGVFAGGTFCYEAQLNLINAGLACYSNAPADGAKKLNDISFSQTNTILDLGDDDFTKGKPHPMIDPSTRNQRIIQEAQDPDTRIIMFDVVLGYGASLNPVDELIEICQQSLKKAHEQQRSLIFMTHICGTDCDPQDKEKIRQLLQQAGIIICDSNYQMVTAAVRYLKH